MVAPVIMAGVKLASVFAPQILGLFSSEKQKDVQRISDVVLETAKVLTGCEGEDEALQVLSASPELALQYQKALLEDAHVSDRLAYGDVSDAREMQKIALQQDDLFSKRFPYYYASAWSLFAFIYIGCVTFIPIPENSLQIAYTILGFLLGTALSSVFQYLFGSSVGSKNKDKINLFSKFGK